HHPGSRSRRTAAATGAGATTPALVSATARAAGIPAVPATAGVPLAATRAATAGVPATTGRVRRTTATPGARSPIPLRAGRPGPARAGAADPARGGAGDRVCLAHRKGDLDQLPRAAADTG